MGLDCCHVDEVIKSRILPAPVVQKVSKLYLDPRVSATMCTKTIFTRHIRTKVTFGSVGSGQPCSPRWVDRIQIRRIRIRIRPIERVRIQWIRWIGIPILPIEHALSDLIILTFTWVILSLCKAASATQVTNYGSCASNWLPCNAQSGLCSALYITCAEIEAKNALNIPIWLPVEPLLGQNTDNSQIMPIMAAGARIRVPM